MWILAFPVTALLAGGATSRMQGDAARFADGHGGRSGLERFLPVQYLVCDGTVAAGIESLAVLHGQPFGSILDVKKKGGPVYG